MLKLHHARIEVLWANASWIEEKELNEIHSSLLFILFLSCRMLQIVSQIISAMLMYGTWYLMSVCVCVLTAVFCWRCSMTALKVFMTRWSSVLSSLRTPVELVFMCTAYELLAVLLLGSVCLTPICFCHFTWTLLSACLCVFLVDKWSSDFVDRRMVYQMVWYQCCEYLTAQHVMSTKVATRCVTSPQSNLRTARRSSANKTYSKLLSSYCSSTLTPLAVRGDVGLGTAYRLIQHGDG